MIADFEQGGTADVSGTPLGLNGVWYEIGSAGTTPPPPSTLTPTTSGGCNSTNYVQISGTTGAVSVFAALQGDFVDTSNVAQPYTIPASYNAFVFCIQGSAPGGQVFFSVSDAATTQSSDNAGQMVPITGSWQSVTVCFNHMQSQGFGVTTVGHMFDSTTAVSFSWKLNAPSSPFNIAIDNFQFAQVPAGNCPVFTATPTPNPKLIWTNSSSNHIDVINGRNGYWYCYSDLGTSGTVGGSGYVSLGTYPITIVPGETAASNPISIQASGTPLTSGTIAAGTTLVWGVSTTYTGNGGVSQFTTTNGAQFQMANPGSPTSPNYCAYYTGTIGPGCSGNDILGAYSECPFAGMGFNFIDSGTGPKQVYDFATQLPFTPTGISFYAKVDNPPAATSNWWFFVPDQETDGPGANSDSWGFSFAPTTSWLQYGATTGFTAYKEAFTGNASDGTALDTTMTYGCKWQQTSGLSGYGLYVDDIYFY